MGRNAVVSSVVAILLALSGAVVVWLLAASEGPGSAPLAAPREAEFMESRTASSDVAVEAAEVDFAPEEESQRTAVEGAPADPLAASPAVFRGRVIDADGVPLAGVTAKVHGWRGNAMRMDAYRAEHGELDWEDPPEVVTDASGRFEIAFAPPPPFQFVLDLKREGLVELRGRWSEIQAGEIKDFGDLTMRVGARVTGRLVDRRGDPVARPQDPRFRLSINRSNRSDQPRSDMVPDYSVDAEVAADGSFTMREPVTPGTWNISLRGPLPIEQRQEVEISAPETDFAVAVYRDEELLRVSGAVVDGSGAPVPHVDFDPHGVGRASNWIQATDREGRFEFVQRPDAVDPDQPFRLRFQKEGFTPVTTSEIRWGELELRVVMQRAPVMEVLVLRASDRSPLEEYGLRLRGASGFHSSNGHQIVGGWEHPGGRTRVEGLLQSGLARIIVDPRQGSGLARAVAQVEVDLAAPPSPTILVPAAAERRVRVQDSSGRRIEGSRVELIDACGETIEVATFVTNLDGRRSSSLEIGVLLASGITDAAGEVALTAPVGVPVVVRCTGPHPPTVLQDVLLEDDGLVVTVESGATLRIRFEPVEVVTAWRADAERLADLGMASLDQASPRVFLHRVGGARVEVFPTGGSAEGPAGALDPGGLAELRGVPGGLWRVLCNRLVQRADSGYQSQHLELSEPVALRDGSTEELTFDLSAYRMGTVVGWVGSADGRPLEAGRVDCQRELSTPGPDGRPRTESYSISFDGDGRFRHDLPVGHYRCTVPMELPTHGTERGGWAFVVAEGTLEVRAGEVTETELTVALARADVQVLGPDGEAVAGLQLFPPDGPAQPAATDEQGRTRIFGTAGSYWFGCRIRSLMDGKAYRAHVDEVRERHGGDYTAEVAAALATTLVQLDQPVTLAVGGGPEIVLRLPAAWDR